jgi:hypothetical protein
MDGQPTATSWTAACAYRRGDRRFGDLRRVRQRRPARLDVSASRLWKFAVKNGAGKPVAITTRCVLVAGLILFGAADNAIYALEGGN